MPGPEPPVVGGLQIDQALEFQRRFQKVQRVAWWLLSLLPLLAIVGLFGGGLFSEVSTAGADGEVSYDRFSRLSADTDITVTVRLPRQPVVVSVSREFLDRYSVTEIRPQPGRVTARADGTSFAFAASPGAQVRLTLQPQRLGSAVGTVSVAGMPPVHLRQFVYP